MRFSGSSLVPSALPLTRFGATLAVSALALTGCGLGASGSPSADPSTATPEPSSSSSASSGKTGFSKVTDSPSASAGASSSSSAASSGPSSAGKALAIDIEFDRSFDDYVPATEEAPAQNVPRPIDPAGMNEHTQDGFVKFFEYYIAERNYAITSGDTARWRELVTPAGEPNPFQQAELEFLDKVDAAYKNGGWVVRGHRQSVADYYMIGKGSEFGEYVLNTYLVENGTVLLDPEGRPPRVEWIPVTEDAYFYGMAADYQDGAWVFTMQATDYSDTMPVPAGN